MPNKLSQTAQTEVDVSNFIPSSFPLIFLMAYFKTELKSHGDKEPP
jgi:hypothetical protein